MSNTVNVCVVGYGMGKHHCGIIKSVEGLNLYAVCDIAEERCKAAEKEFGVKTFNRVADALGDSEVQLVIIATPHDTHKPLAIQAMDAGRHVVVEKVMCLDTAEADAMIAASKKNGVMLSVFQNRRWDTDYLTVRKIVESGMIGELFYVESTVTGYGSPGGWRRDAKHGGGQLYDWGAHLVDQCVQMVPSEAETVFCDFQYRVWDVDTESYAKVVVRFKNKVVFDIQLGSIARTSKPRWYVLGEKGAVIKHGFDATPAKVKTEVNGFAAEMNVECVLGDWNSYYENISAVLNKGAELIVDPDGVRKAIAVIAAARKSARTGEAVGVERS